MRGKLTLLGILLASPALGATDANLTITGVGSQYFGTSSYGYMYFLNSMSGGCPANLVYIDLSTDAGRAMLAMAMTARAAGKPIARVDYTGGSGAACYATLVQM